MQVDRDKAHKSQMRTRRQSCPSFLKPKDHPDFDTEMNSFPSFFCQSLNMLAAGVVEILLLWILNDCIACSETYQLYYYSNNAIKLCIVNVTFCDELEDPIAVLSKKHGAIYTCS